jgi:Tfp pilus assembly protein PilN
MISLLPPEQKREISAARTNTLLIRYNVLLLGALAFLLLSIGIVYFYLNNAKTNNEKVMSENQAKVANFSTIAEQAQIFRQNLSTAKQILDRQVNYTKVILEIAQLLPGGVVLTNLSLDAATFGSETTLVAQAKSYDQAVALKDSFSQSPLFSNVHFQSINTTEGAAGNTYPITVTLSVTFKKGAAKS